MLARPGASNLWLFLDENPYTINDGFFEEDPSGSGTTPTATGWIDCPAAYHEGGAGDIAFCDGHTQIRKWTDTTVLGWNHPAAGGIVGAQTPDLNWLMSLTTAHK